MGIIVETHYPPKESISDANQTIPTVEFAQLIKELAAVAEAVGRKILLPAVK